MLNTTTRQLLLQPVRLGDLKLPNRIVMAPMTRARADNADLAPLNCRPATTRSAPPPA
ncbi:MAG: NADH:flavin oxidoreductase / oxidase family [Mycobacterium sp.]|jgi:N-ethylmaleimide reductase|nr:alkene reductase [Mycobacterium sp.]MDT5232132.1 NADH:flavin oxidoreductase / oxidase family [Mycobacterium sp.]MDT5266937.1 NADH:flavin oxidoreductase / oxidase family [Mycobacterium sp.]